MLIRIHAVEIGRGGLFAHQQHYLVSLGRTISRYHSPHTNRRSMRHSPFTSKSTLSTTTFVYRFRRILATDITLFFNSLSCMEVRSLPYLYSLLCSTTPYLYTAFRLRDIFLVRAVYWITALENTAGNIPSLVRRLHAYANTIKPLRSRALGLGCKESVKRAPIHC